MSGPLDGVRVIDLTINVLGPMATQVLGDCGADVIKIEAPEGDPVRLIGPSRTTGMGPYFLNLNRNKRSVVLDLKTPAGKAALKRLVETADVFVHNMRIGAIERLGFGYESVAAYNPRIVYASATGFRRGSRYHDRGAFDDVVQGLSGIASLNAVNGHPRYFPTVIADKFTGHSLASAVGMALYAREKTGRGQQVHLPMMEAMVAFTMVEHLWGATFREPSLGLGYSRMLSPNRRPFATKDGHVCFLAVKDDQWQRLYRALGRPELIDDPRFATLAARTEHVDLVLGTVAAELKDRTTAEVVALLDKADVPNGVVNSIEDLLDDEYLAETGFFQNVEHPTEGPLTLMSIPASFDGTPASIRGLPPVLGEHTESVLLEAGLTAAEVAALRR